MVTHVHLSVHVVRRLERAAMDTAYAVALSYWVGSKLLRAAGRGASRSDAAAALVAVAVAVVTALSRLRARRRPPAPRPAPRPPAATARRGPPMTPPHHALPTPSVSPVPSIETDSSSQRDDTTLPPSPAPLARCAGVLKEAGCPNVRRAQAALRDRCGALGLTAEDCGRVLSAFSDEYVRSCVSQPHRTLESHIRRLQDTLEWRARVRPWQAAASGGRAAAEGVLSWCWMSQPDGSRVAVVFSSPGKVRRMDAAALELAHIAVLEEVVAAGASSYCMVIDAGGLSFKHASTDFMRRIHTLATVGYRGRLASCIAGPATAVAMVLWRLLKGVLPPSIFKKVCICESPTAELAARGLVGNVPEWLR
eukprot:TRINITY_DN1085_c0_g2_i1.p1 TRINITY_DN1085_c0_g2~~TRINITY_DN1085_c0_g2_i1.p1  ORF type:complete len:365 (+),score=104.26 TRINITY_DN1085_c0_g2_i1:56-1150(+)